MPVVTITSDFGMQDYYLAIMKGALLSEQTGLHIIDISHNVQNYDIVQAAFMVKNAYHSFPKGTIHIVSVNNCYANDSTFLAARFDGHYFLAPDNGVLSLMFDTQLKDIFELEYPLEGPFPWKTIYAKAVAHLAQGLPINEIGIPIESIEQRLTFQPVITKSSIKGSIIHVDTYDNAIVNISRQLFEQVSAGRNFEITFKRHEPISQMSQSYADVPLGETLCFFNSADFLEIAINMGKASSLLGLKVEESVQIDFDN